MRRATVAAAMALTLPLLEGCGRSTARHSATAKAPPEPGWSFELAALMPAIRACLAENGTAAAVTRAWPMANDLAGVRVLRADGGRLDCVAAADGRRVVLTEPVVAGSRRAQEEAPLFTPKGGEPPRGPCVATVPAVVGAERVGWLSYAGCDGREGPPSAAARRGAGASRPPLPSV